MYFLLKGLEGKNENSPFQAFSLCGCFNILPERLDKQLQHFGTNHIVDYEHLIDAPKEKPY
jgi:hypothetical protein